MGELFVSSIDVPTATLGRCSPLPPLTPPNGPVEIRDPAIPADLAGRTVHGWPTSMLPYLDQDDYGRELTIRRQRVAVLQNDALRATIALDLGGRVLSLFDRRAGRELLYVNPVLQPANLALRNAWFSGGIEWNIGTRGHSPLTMETLHAARVEGIGGEPVLRLWEYERLRGVVFQVDLWLPPSRPLLLARPRIRNVDDVPVPMYWWTNTAVVAGDGTRVVAPAERAFRTEYPNALRIARLPDDGQGDVSYPARHLHAADFFFDIAPTQRAWIAAIEDNGTGIAHVSTAALRGRKLFVWGRGRGGRRWQRWLSHCGSEEYAEIQGGLLPTQFEHATMPARSEWSWTEAFGAIAVDARRSHGASWSDAVAHVGAAVDELVAAGRLDELHESAGTVADRPPLTPLATGSGWGALERMRRAVAGERWFDDAGTPFADESLGPEQAPWLALLRTATLPAHPPTQPPDSYVIGSDWEARLAAAPPTWLTEYLRAVMRHGAGDIVSAVDHYERSLALETNAWALRGLAVAAAASGRSADAARHAVDAWRLAPDEWRLAAEAVSALIDHGRPTDALALLSELRAGDRNRGRLRLLDAWAAVAAGDADRTRAILAAGLEVADVREGERSLDRLWSAVHPDREPPAEYDFRMSEVPALEP